jgi:HlyD family secretion protein
MKRKTLIVGGLATAALVALLAWAFAPRPTAVETARADRGLFETTIDEEGRTALRDRFVVSAPLGGRLMRITLEAGDAVAAGDVVALLTPTPAPLLDARTQRELAARAEGARAGLQRAARQAEAARVALAQARSEAERSEQLAAQGFVSPNRAESDRLALASAEQQLAAALAGRRVAEQELAMARAALEATQPGADTAAGFAVRAPVSGRVLRVLHASEGAVAPGTPLLEVGDTAALEVVAELLTADALQATPGREVRIGQWGGSGELAGRVRLVEPSAFTKVSALGVEEQRVNVRIDIVSPQERWQALGDGFRVGVRILTQRVEDALRVPVSAVFPLPPAADGASPGFAVFVVDDGRARLRPVALGGRNARHAWLTDGLAAGDEVIIYPPPDVADGVRVAVRSR